MADNSSASRLQMALTAVRQPSADETENKLSQLIAALEEHYGDNQKEVAGELQRLAKEIEAAGQTEQAIEFKQRTTEIMLRLSMERRRGLKQGPRLPSSTGSFAAMAPQQVMPAASLFESVRYIAQSSLRFEAELRFFSEIMRGSVTWFSDDPHKRSVCIKLAREPEILLLESQMPTTAINIYAVTTFSAVSERLEANGFHRRGELRTPLGQALLFGNQDGLVLGILPVANNRQP